jgi:hypothetical protein
MQQERCQALIMTDDSNLARCSMSALAGNPHLFNPCASLSVGCRVKHMGWNMPGFPAMCWHAAAC